MVAVKEFIVSESSRGMLWLMNDQLEEGQTVSGLRREEMGGVKMYSEGRGVESGRGMMGE